MTPASKRASGTDPTVAAWSRSQSSAQRALCDDLRKLIDGALPKASSKVWHGAPVWFIGENPIVGYSVKTKGVSLLFWNGQAFKEPGLVPVGKHGAAEALFGDGAELDSKTICRWLKQAGTNVLDSKAYFRKLREGRGA
jgi:hypothetical protein